jgi:hypothetical protein
MMRALGAAAIVGSLLGGVTLAGCSSGDAREIEPGSAESVKAQFAGNYELLHYVTFAEDGTVTDMNYSGRIMYDEHGNMSAIGMPRDLPDRAASAPQGQIPRAGFAYFGRWDIDVADDRVTHHVHGSPMNPAWFGTDLVRYFEFTEDQLALSIRNAQGRVTGTLTWRRFP